MRVYVCVCACVCVYTCVHVCVRTRAVYIFSYTYSPSPPPPPPTRHLRNPGRRLGHTQIIRRGIHVPFFPPEMHLSRQNGGADAR